MKKWITLGLMSAGFVIGMQTASFAQGLTKPVPLISKIVTGMPTTAEQEIRVLTAEFKPGDKTVFHTHRFPVTVYVLEGSFTLNLESEKAPVTVKAGEAYVEPPNVKMTGFNLSKTDRLRVVIFYVSEKGTPFLDMLDPMPGKPSMDH